MFQFRLVCDKASSEKLESIVIRTSQRFENNAMRFLWRIRVLTLSNQVYFDSVRSLKTKALINIRDQTFIEYQMRECLRFIANLRLTRL